MPDSTIGDVGLAQAGWFGREWSEWLGATAVVLFCATAAAFTARCAMRGRFRDAEIDRRGSSVVLGNWVRTYFAWVMQPVLRGLLAVGITPNSVTVVSVLLAAAAGFRIAVGDFTGGGLLYLVSGACDFLDGRLARVAGTVTPGGAALDSILDRYSECAILTGLAWFYRDSWMLAAVLFLISGSLLVPYIRARGEGLGIEVKLGLMQRPERVVLLGAATLFADAVDTLADRQGREPRFLSVVVCVILLAATTHLTALHRLTYVVRTLNRRAGPSDE